MFIFRAYIEKIQLLRILVSNIAQISRFKVLDFVPLYEIWETLFSFEY